MLRAVGFMKTDDGSAMLLEGEPDFKLLDLALVEIEKAIKIVSA